MPMSVKLENVEKVYKYALNQEWTCPGYPPHDSSIAGADGQILKVGGRKCGTKIRLEWLDDYTRVVNGRILCLKCAELYEKENELYISEGMARELGVSPKDVVEMRKWKSEIDKKLSNPDDEIDIMDAEKSKKFLSGRKMYPVLGQAKCTNPHDQQKPILKKIKEIFKKTPAPIYTLPKSKEV